MLLSQTKREDEHNHPRLNTRGGRRENFRDDFSASRIYLRRSLNKIRMTRIASRPFFVFKLGFPPYMTCEAQFRHTSSGTASSFKLLSGVINLEIKKYVECNFHWNRQECTDSVAMGYLKQHTAN